MESHGIFGRERGGGGGGGRGGRRVNFKSEHDDRFGDGDQGGYDQNRRQGYNNRSRGGGRWTRGGRGRDSRRGGYQNYRNSGDDYGERKRYTPYNTRGSQRGGRGDNRGSKKGSVFARLGDQEKKRGGVFGRLGDDMGNQGQSWHKIMIIGGADGNQDDIIGDLQSQIQEPFQPQQIHSKGDKLMFFIEESRAAMELKRLRDQSVIVKPSPPPRQGGGSRDDGDWNSRGRGFGSNRGGMNQGGGRRGSGGAWNNMDKRMSLQRSDSDFMEEDCTQILLQVLGERYDSINMSLDLSDMFHDRTLQQHSIRGSMFDANFVNSILELISTHCPNLNALDLSKNRLQRLDLYSSLKDKCSNLQIIDLSDNELNHVNSLEALGQVSTVVNLVLENNPLQQFHSDFASYAGNVRKYFPNLQILDGQQLPSPVKFDLPSSSGSLPPSQKGYLVNEEVRTLVVSFLEQYYTIYDGETRDKLLEAYSDNAVFSMCVNIPQHQIRNNSYPPSRNLARVNETGKRSALIKRGRIDIVQLLRNLPRSYHIADTFNVDVMRASPVCTAFTVHGIFSEAASGPKSDFFPIRSFSRTFVIVPAGNGVAIVNDQLSIRTASSQMIQQHQEAVKAHFSPSPAVPQGFSSMGPSSSGLSTSPFSSSTLPPLQQQQPFLPPPSSATGMVSTGYGNPQDEAIARLSSTTGMNIEWSKKCLAENGWEFEKALTAFNVIHSQGKIPSEAFS